MTSSKNELECVHFIQVDDIAAQIEPLYMLLKQRLSLLLPSAKIEHIGSTAVSGSLTKGDLDVLVLVRECDFPKSQSILSNQFKANIGTEGSKDFASFVCDDYPRSVGIQLMIQDAVWPPFIQWRELLLNDVHVKQEYDDLKRFFEGKLMSDYRNAKEQLIDRYFPDPDD